MADGNFGLRIGIEGEKQFKQALADINRSFKVLASEMNLVASQFDKNDKSIQALSSRKQVLTKEIDAQKDKIATLQAAHKNAAESFGESDKRTQNWAIQLNNAKAKLNDMERELSANNKQLSAHSKSTDDAAGSSGKLTKATDEFGKSTEKVKTVNETLQTTVSQHATTISLNASNITSLSGRITTAEAAINLLPTTIRLNVESLIAPAPLIRGWERNRWNNSNGTHINDTSAIRGIHDIPVTQGEQFVGQTADGTALAFEYYWYNSSGTFISATMNTTNVATAPANAAALRVANRNHSSPPEEFTGTVVRGNTRINMTVRPVSASTILMQNNFINLRVAKDEVINKINISPESILIAGNKIRITGQTTIDNAVITNAMIANLAVNTAKIADASISTAKIADLAVSTAKIANAAITNAKIGNLAVGTAQIADAAITTVKIGDAQINNAKIANLDAGKINTGTLSADRIAAGSITSAKLTIANGFITNAMIADATILNAKIGTVDAAKITTGTLNAARIGANSITADKISANFLQTLTGSASIRITGTTISYYSGSNLTAQLNSSGLELTRDNIKIGRIGTNNMSANSTWRGLVFDLENAGNYMCWAWRETANASSYTTKLTYYRSRLQNGMEKGFHFDDAVFLKGGQSAASGSTVVTNNWGFWTFGSTSYLGRVTTNSKAGVALGGSSLILGSQGNWVDFNTIRAICALLSGRRIYLPASSGGLSSWWDTSFPSMTTWST